MKSILQPERNPITPGQVILLERLCGKRSRHSFDRCMKKKRKVRYSADVIDKAMIR
jgi:hypothetical protein